MINDLYQAMHAEKEKEVLSSLLERMIIYAAMHFAKEEHYFDVFQYPEKDYKIAEDAFEKISKNFLWDKQAKKYIELILG